MKLKAKFRVNDLVKTVALKKIFSKADTTSCHITYINLQKILMIQHRVFALINYKSVILKLYWERQS